MAELKICSTCKVVKPLSEFHKAASQKTGLNPRCKDCKRNAHKKWAYGIANFNEIYASLFEAQDGLCALCDQPETIIDKRTGELHRLSMDHSHTTGIIRGLLCRRCNYALGVFEGMGACWLRRAWTYLKGGD